jgi:L-fuculose-phosphate aldolase
MDAVLQNKTDLALCIRMLEAAGIIDYNGHCSIRAPGGMYINIGSETRSTLTAEGICTADFDGQVIEGAGTPPLEFHLHAGIYKARPEVNAVVHAHPKWSTYLTMTGTEYLPVFAQGSLIYPMPLLDTPDSINSVEMSDRLNAVLGDKSAALMKSHGAVTVGADIREAFVLINYLEENAERQYRALQIGTPYAFSDAECAAAATKLRNPKLFQRTWDHFTAKLRG